MLPNQTTVAILCEYPSLNGGEYSLLAALPFLREQGITPVVVTQPPGPLSELLATLGVAMQPVRLRDDEGCRLPQPTVRANLVAAIGRVNPNLVHANSLSMSRLLGPIANQLGLPCIGHLRDIVGLSRQAVVDLNRLSRLLAVSQATLRWHVAQGVQQDRVMVQYNGVDLVQFQPSARRGDLQLELGLKPATRTIATIGQIGLRKGMDLVLEGAQMLAEEFSDVHWLVVGERHSEKAESVAFERRLHEMADSPPLQGRVHFVGRRDIARLLVDVNIVVLASRQEPFGRILLESAATGRPIIATRVGGTEEMFPPEIGAARLVQPEDSTAISVEMRGLLRDPDGAARLGMMARRHVELHFDVAKRGPELAKHYFELLGVSSSPHLPTAPLSRHSPDGSA